MVDRQRLARARAMWRYVGDELPPFAAVPLAGQESVWRYPRPPRLAPDARQVRVLAPDGSLLAHSQRALRLLETASPPTFYLPAADVRTDWLVPAPGSSHCEWKGQARYWALVDGAVADRSTSGGSPPHAVRPDSAAADGASVASAPQVDALAGLAPGTLAERLSGADPAARPIHEPVVWSYPQPLAPYEALAGYLGFYPARVACFVDRHRALPQPGGFYGGWITPELAGPFKGEPGSHGW